MYTRVALRINNTLLMYDLVCKYSLVEDIVLYIKLLFNLELFCPLHLFLMQFEVAFVMCQLFKKRVLQLQPTAICLILLCIL